MVNIIDLYCGLGGLGIGFEYTKSFKVVGGIDFAQYAVNTFSKYHKLHGEIHENVHDMTTIDPQKYCSAVGYTSGGIVGGPPCQGFSVAGKRLSDFADDKRNQQVFNYLRFIKEIHPDFFVMENVPGILKTGQKKERYIINFLIEEFENIGYGCSYKILTSSDYRTPQKRKRFFLIGINGRRRFVFPDAICGDRIDLFGQQEPYHTVAEALSDLPLPNATGEMEYHKEPKTKLQKFLRNGNKVLKNHMLTKHSEDMIAKLKEQKAGTCLYPNWNHSWYKLVGDRPAPTVKENHRATSVHYKEPRCISPRECARLQTLPDDLELVGTKTEQLIMVGNAVPSVLSAHLASAILRQVYNKTPKVDWSEANSPISPPQE
jgi:DNA (cytosine-5)-methyltransferase 1